MVFWEGSDTWECCVLRHFIAYTPCPMAADCRRYGEVRGFFQHCGGRTPFFRNPRGCTRFRRRRSGGLKAAILLRICGAAAFYGILSRIRHAPWRQIAAATETYRFRRHRRGDARGVVYHCGDVRSVVTAAAEMYAIPRSTRPFSRARTARRPQRPGTRTRPRS